MRQAFVQGYAADQLSYLEREDELDEEWVAAATISDDLAWLTAQQLHELTAELDELRGELRGELVRAGAAPVRIIYSAYRRP